MLGKWVCQTFIYGYIVTRNKDGWPLRNIHVSNDNVQGRIPHPLKLEKIWFFFGVKSRFFTRNTPIFFAPPSAIGKNMIFWRKIVFFHMKYPNIFRASSARRNFFKCAPPLTWNPGSAPDVHRCFLSSITNKICTGYMYIYIRVIYMMGLL